MDSGSACCRLSTSKRVITELENMTPKIDRRRGRLKRLSVLEWRQRLLSLKSLINESLRAVGYELRCLPSERERVARSINLFHHVTREWLASELSRKTL